MLLLWLVNCGLGLVGWFALVGAFDFGYAVYYDFTLVVIDGAWCVGI